MPSGQHPLPQQVIVHLSDLHLGAKTALPSLPAVHPDDRLAEALRTIRASGIRPAAIIVTGDVADSGEPGAYARARRQLEALAGPLGARLIWVMGNHDVRSAFRSELLDQPPSDAEVDAVHDLDGLRVVVLDTSVPGRDHGELTATQLEWLEDVLAVPSARGTLIAMHHPPVPVVIAPSDDIELHGQDRLAAILAGSDVRAVIAGHLHYATSSMIAGLPVWVATACCYSIDPLAPDGYVRGQDGGQSISLLHVLADRMVHTSAPLGPFPTLYTFAPRPD